MPLLFKRNVCVYLLKSSFQSFVHLIQPLGLRHLWRRWLGREGKHSASSRGSLSCTQWGAEHREAPETHVHVHSFNTAVHLLGNNLFNPHFFSYGLSITVHSQLTQKQEHKSVFYGWQPSLMKFKYSTWDMPIPSFTICLLIIMATLKALCVWRRADKLLVLQMKNFNFIRRIQTNKHADLSYFKLSNFTFIYIHSLFMFPIGFFRMTSKGCKMKQVAVALQNDIST